MSIHGGHGRNPFIPDERDYPVMVLKAMVKAGMAKAPDWTVPRILDQGKFGTCVGAGILGMLDCDDATHTDPSFQSSDIKPFFKKIPGHGALPQGGAQVRDGLKLAQDLGYIKAYSPLTNLLEIQDWYQNYGPVLVGTDWLSDMESPDDSGLVACTGDVLGGHCYYGNGDDIGLDWIQSWGLTFGVDGHFHTTVDAWINGPFKNGGEAWATVQAVPHPAPPIEPPSGPVSDALQLLQITMKDLGIAERYIESVVKHWTDS